MRYQESKRLVVFIYRMLITHGKSWLIIEHTRSGKLHKFI